MSLGLRRLSYATSLTPQVKQKKRCLQGAFFAERVAVLRQSNSHHRTGNSGVYGAVEGL